MSKVNKGKVGMYNMYMGEGVSEGLVWGMCILYRGGKGEVGQGSVLGMPTSHFFFWDIVFKQFQLSSLLVLSFSYFSVIKGGSGSFVLHLLIFNLVGWPFKIPKLVGSIPTVVGRGLRWWQLGLIPTNLIPPKSHQEVYTCSTKLPRVCCFSRPRS